MPETEHRFAINYDWVDKAEAQKILGIKRAQLTADTKILLDLETPGFDYELYKDKGYSRDSMVCLVAFRKLVLLKGRKRAISEINLFMERYWDERER